MRRRVRRRNGVDDPAGHESAGGEGGPGGGRGWIRDSRHARGCSCLGNPPGATSTTQGTVTKTILQNIQVLSAGTDIQKDAEGKPQQVQVVNLLVSPGAGADTEPGEQRIEDSTGAAQSAGYKDREGSGRLDGPDVWRQAAPPRGVRRAPRAAAKVFTIEVINGNKRAKKNSNLPRQSSESEGRHFHRMFQRILSCPLRRAGFAGAGCAIGFSRREQLFRIRRMSFRLRLARRCWWIAFGRRPGSDRTGRSGRGHRNQPDRDHGERQGCREKPA